MQHVVGAPQRKEKKKKNNNVVQGDCNKKVMSNEVTMKSPNAA